MNPYLLQQCDYNERLKDNLKGQLPTASQGFFFLALNVQSLKIMIPITESQVLVMKFIQINTCVFHITPFLIL